MKRALNIILCLSVLGFTETLFAHHGWGGYNLDLTLNGKVVKTRFAFPHDIIHVEDTDGNIWELLLAPPNRNRRFGYDENTVSPGDIVEVVGQRAKNRFEGKVHYINNDQGETVYTYYYSNGETSIERLQRKSK